MSILNHPLWPKVQHYFHLSGISVEVTNPFAEEELVMLLNFTDACPACDAEIHPIRKRNIAGRKTPSLRYSTSCPVAPGDTRCSMHPRSREALRELRSYLMNRNTMNCNTTASEGVVPSVNAAPTAKEI